jgi:tripartite-type tricarboxylate transporter receptor subunit TctC
MFINKFVKNFVMALAILFSYTTANSQNYPDKSIKVVVPFSPGAGTDTLARIVGNKFAELIGQPIVIENRPGAGGAIGTELVAKATPDGYSLLFTPSSFAINSNVLQKINFDPKTDFISISLVASLPVLLAVPSNFPVNSIKELVQYSQKNPDKLSMGSSGNGTVFHLTGELFKIDSGINFVHIPFKGGSPAVTALLGNQVNMLFETPVTLMPHVNAGKLKIIGVASSKRLPYLPNVPTFVESGYPSVVSENWYAYLSPKGTPQVVIDKVYTTLGRTIQDGGVQKQLTDQGADIRYLSPNETKAFIDKEIIKWEKVIKTSGVKVD